MGPKNKPRFSEDIACLKIDGEPDHPEEQTEKNSTRKVNLGSICRNKMKYDSFDGAIRELAV